jgi:hypothetical protein
VADHLMAPRLQDRQRQHAKREDRDDANQGRPPLYEPDTKQEVAVLRQAR